jgi:hypothetical protein
VFIYYLKSGFTRTSLQEKRNKTQILKKFNPLSLCIPSMARREKKLDTASSLSVAKEVQRKLEKA